MTDLERIDMVTGQVPLPGMPEDGVLFHVDNGPATEPMSADRRRSARQRHLVEMGRHPLTGSATRPDLGSCGDCAHRVFVGHHGRIYPKCDVSQVSHGAATDVRRWWPACGRWEPKP